MKASPLYLANGILMLVSWFVLRVVVFGWMGVRLWGMRLQVKPFMRWVWLGAIFMAIGGLLAMLDKRYRTRRDSKNSSAQNGQEAAA